MFVDTHAHLYAPEFDQDLEEVLERARAAGVTNIVCPATDLETSRACIALADRFQMVYAAVGIHPHEASKAARQHLAEIEQLCSHPKVVAIGEIGLDYHYDFSPPDVQRSLFETQLSLAATHSLPVIIHSRKAEADTVSIVNRVIDRHPHWNNRHTVRRDRYPVPRGVFHCFPGDAALAWQVIDRGFFVSLPGFVTFPEKPGRPNSMVEVASRVSCEHILLETDSPYLAPVPHRGKRNEPSAIPLIAKKIAELQNLSVEDIERTSTFGAHLLFGIGAHPSPVFVYRLRNSLYLNITIRCNADCIFCDRKGEAIIKGHNLRIEKEPTAEEVIRAVDDPTKYEEIVFCGYGEPTIRMDVVKDVARWVKARGGKVRLNTDGHGNVINHRNIVPELVGVVDSVSISLNSTDPDQYGKLMRLDGQKYFAAMVDFARECVRHRLPVTMTIVDLSEVDHEQARKFVQEEIGATYRERPFF